MPSDVCLHILCAGKIHYFAFYVRGYLCPAHLWIVEASGIRIRGVSVLRRSHLHICRRSASLLQGLTGIRYLTSSWMISKKKKKKRQISRFPPLRSFHHRFTGGVKDHLLPFCEPVLIVVSGVISACEEVKHGSLDYCGAHFD